MVDRATLLRMAEKNGFTVSPWDNKVTISKGDKALTYRSYKKAYQYLCQYSSRQKASKELEEFRYALSQRK